MTVYQYPTPPPYVFDPEEAHRLMFDAVEYIPLAILPFNDPPPGQVACPPGKPSSTSTCI